MNTLSKMFSFGACILIASGCQSTIGSAGTNGTPLQVTDGIRKPYQVASKAEVDAMYEQAMKALREGKIRPYAAYARKHNVLRTEAGRKKYSARPHPHHHGDGKRKVQVYDQGPKWSHQHYGALIYLQSSVKGASSMMWMYDELELPELTGTPTQGTVNDRHLFAPTLISPGNDPYEITAAYSRKSGTSETTRALSIFKHTPNGENETEGFLAAYPMEDLISQNWAQGALTWNDTDSIVSYVAVDKLTDGKWAPYIFNYTDWVWDELATPTTDIGHIGNGWNIAETFNMDDAPQVGNLDLVGSYGGSVYVQEMGSPYVNTVDLDDEIYATPMQSVGWPYSTMSRMGMPSSYLGYWWFGCGPYGCE